MTVDLFAGAASDKTSKHLTGKPSIGPESGAMSGGYSYVLQRQSVRENTAGRMPCSGSSHTRDRPSYWRSNE